MRPNRNIQKIMLSSPASFKGEFETRGILLTHVWPGQKPQRTWRHDKEGPASRHALVAVFDTSNYNVDPPFLIPDFSETGEMMCDLFSILFGKRFDNCGSLEESGFFRLPDLAAFELSLNHYLPFHSQKERADFAFPLDLNEVGRLRLMMLDPGIDQEAKACFSKAIRFYRLALQGAERDIEISYVRLINAIEVLFPTLPFKSDDLLDDERKQMLKRLTLHTDDQKLISFVRQSLKQIKRRFIRTVADFASPIIFANSESENSFRLFNSENLEVAMSAAYDIRSRYVHDGLLFGGWLGPSGYQNLEFMLGKAVGQDDKLTTTLYNAPTFVGLERLVRVTLLRFAVSRGLICLDSAPSE